MIKQQNICAKCILPEGFLGVHLDLEGTCDYCNDPSHKNINWSRTEINQKKRDNALADWRTVVDDMQKNHGNIPYDCIFSLL